MDCMRACVAFLIFTSNTGVLAYRLQHRSHLKSRSPFTKNLPRISWKKISIQVLPSPSQVFPPQPPKHSFIRTLTRAFTSHTQRTNAHPEAIGEACSVSRTGSSECTDDCQKVSREQLEEVSVEVNFPILRSRRSSLRATYWSCKFLAVSISPFTLP